MKNVLFQIALLLVTTSSLIAQDKVQITGTNLKVALPKGFIVDQTSPLILSDDYQIAIIEMSGMNFNEGISDFDNIEEKYAEKGVTVIKNQKGKLGSYEALFIVLESAPAIYQIFLGNDEFCAIVNVIAEKGTVSIDEVTINQIFSTIEFESSTTSALEEHANFTISEENTGWKFMTYTANTFSFQHEETESAALIMQLPPETLTLLGTQKELATGFKEKMKSSVSNLKVLQEGEWRTEHLEGYRMILEASEDDEKGLLYLFIFGNENAAHVFQGISSSNSEAIQQTLEAFVKGIQLKE